MFCGIIYTTTDILLWNPTSEMKIKRKVLISVMQELARHWKCRIRLKYYYRNVTLCTNKLVLDTSKNNGSSKIKKQVSGSQNIFKCITNCINTNFTHCSGILPQIALPYRILWHRKFIKFEYLHTSLFPGRRNCSNYFLCFDKGFR